MGGLPAHEVPGAHHTPSLEEVYGWLLVYSRDLASCDRLRSSMVPKAQRLLKISQDLARTDSGKLGEAKRASLTHAAAEMKASIQSCFDAGETLRMEREPTQAHVAGQ